ncbi:MAG: hypothetical protein DRO63_04575 [Candidatus Gerdarchaeota archaeon]|nr:MAG: hypothetical protein DRO63_04575 [Candidatus Gerdarchaeota archaeon]
MPNKTTEEIAFEVNNSNKKLIFVVGYLDNFTAHNFANDNDYSHLEFEHFLKVNNIDSRYFKETDKSRQTTIPISIESWTQKIAYQEQKDTVVINGFNPQALPDLLTKSLLMQELLYLSKNDYRLKTNLVFFINLTNGALEEQILPKILQNSKIINLLE